MQSSGVPYSALATTNGYTTWPSPFRYPVEQLQPGLLMELNKNKIDLNDTSDSYKNSLRKSLLQILCMEAIRIIRYPSLMQKNDLAMCIIESWPHLREPNGNGYSRWLDGINGTLNTTRQAMGFQRKRKNPPVTLADRTSKDALNGSKLCKVEGTADYSNDITEGVSISDSESEHEQKPTTSNCNVTDHKPGNSNCDVTDQRNSSPESVAIELKPVLMDLVKSWMSSEATKNMAIMQLIDSKLEVNDLLKEKTSLEIKKLKRELYLDEH